MGRFLGEATMEQQDSSEPGASPVQEAEKAQARLYDRKIEKYHAHHADKYSRLYRDRFINNVLFHAYRSTARKSWMPRVVLERQQSTS
jgi:hypothetical protein